MALIKRRFLDKSEDLKSENENVQNQLELDIQPESFESPAPVQEESVAEPEVNESEENDSSEDEPENPASEESSAATETEENPSETEERRTRVVVKPRRRVVVSKTDGERTERTERT